ncbi:DnaJ-class molecular chaperone CbpA [Olavius algarvensis associated proteobacterium Delta 3]|nr:DnaJ-class molecular chaperone CbpA [Olavius algarvensis associated proteobacterium Delta 3]
MEYKDYYSILGVDRKASQDDIKKAFRKLARKYHPDVNQGDKASEKKFQEINEANEVLSDPEKRKKYDQLGSQWQHHQGEGGRPEDFNWGEWQASANQGQTYRTVSPEEFEEIFGAQGGYSDFFENLFGQGARRQAGGGPGDSRFYYEQQPRRGRDSEHSLQVTLDEAFQGTRRVLEWEDGRKIDAKIPRGVKTGSRVRLKGQGGPGIGGGKSGDLYLTIEVLPDNRFQRDNDDLSTTVSVDLFTMLLGGKIPVAGIDRKVNLDIPAETRNGRVFRLRGLGMPKMKHPDQRGDLYVTVEALLPQRLSEKEKELVEEWRKLR